MDNAFDKRSIGIGFAVLMSIVLIIFGINYLNDTASYSSTIIKIRFDDAQGLKIGSDVKKEGIQIGTVIGYEIEGTSVIIDIEIDKEIKIPIDSRFSITQDGLLGSKFIDIIPGNNTNVFIKSYEKQGIVDSNQPEVSSLTNDLSDFARKLNELLTQDVKNDITKSIMNLKTTSDQIKIFIEKNKDVLTQEEKDNFKMILSNFNEVSENINILVAENSESLGNTLDNFNDFSNSLDPLVQKISILSSHIDSIIIKINEGDGTLSKLIDISEEYIDENNNGKYDLGEQFTDINNNGIWDEGAELYNNANELVVESIDLVLDTKNKIDGIYDNVTSVTDNLNLTIDNFNSLLDEFQTDAGFKKYVKLYLKANKEFKREEK